MDLRGVGLVHVGESRDGSEVFRENLARSLSRSGFAEGGMEEGREGR